MSDALGRGRARKPREHVTRESHDNRIRHILMWPRGTRLTSMIKYSRGNCIPWNVTYCAYFCLNILLYQFLAKRLVRYIIINENEKKITKYGPGSCSFLAHFGVGHYKMGHIPGIQSLITFKPVNRFDQN